MPLAKQAQTMSFIWPIMLLSLLLLPVAAWWYLRLQARRQEAVATQNPLLQVQDRSGQNIAQRRHIPPILFLIGLTFLLIGLARPEMVVALPRIEGTVILAFDVSNSMLAEDFEPNRIEVAKAAAKRFIENQPDTVQVGVVAFGNAGLIIEPPTNDPAALTSAIDRISPQGATSVGQGIFTSIQAVSDQDIELETAEDGTIVPVQIGSYPSAVIVLLSDGENTTSPNPLDIAQIAAEAQVRIYPSGIGSPEGTVIQVDGFNIVTTLNEEILQEIANTTNGSYYFAEDSETLNEIYETIDLQLTVREEMMEITAILAGLSLLFVLAGSLLSMWWFGRMP